MVSVDMILPRITSGEIFYIRVDKKNVLLSTDGVNFRPKRNSESTM
jgi:hypothetical protein